MPSEDSFDSVWSEAIEKYVQITGKSIEDQKLLRQFSSVDDLAEIVDEEFTKFKTYRHKKPKFMNIVKKTGRCFIALSDVASSALSLTPFAPAATIFGAVAFLVQAAGGVSESYDWIEELLEKLGGFTERLEQYVDVGMNSHLRAKVIAILVCLMEILGRATMLMKSGRIKKYAAVVFLGQDDEVKKSFRKIARLFEDEDSLVQAISYATNQRIEQITSEINQTTKQNLEATEGVRKRLDSMSMSARSSQVQTALDSDLLTDAHKKNVAIYNEYLESTIPQTGQWLLEDERTQKWMDQQIHLLWVSGGPGTGKSCLSSKLIHSLRQKYPQDPAHPNRTSVAYFYIKEQETGLQDLCSILKSLAYQITQSDAIFKNFAAGVLSNLDSVATPRALWKNLFLAFYGLQRDLPNAAMIVIDGLDEASRPVLRELFSLLADLADKSIFKDRLSWALFSRPDVSEFLEPTLGTAITKVEIGDRNAGDIAEYIKKRVTQVLVVKQARRDRGKPIAVKLAREIRDRVLAKADGMFFKVVLIMDQIQNKERTKAVIDAIEEAPPQLEAMIAHVFDKLLVNEDVDKDDLNELLLWISFGKQELYLGQLYAILKVRTGQPYEALEARLRGPFASIFRLSTLNTACGQGGDDKQQEMGAETDLFPDGDSGDDFDIDETASNNDREDSYIHLADNDLEDLEASNGDNFSKETMQRFLQTTVTFTHASIRDFVVRQHAFELDAHTGSVAIHVDARTADVHAADVCLQRIIEYGRDPVFADDRPDFRGYSSYWWSDHLLAADQIELSAPETASLTQSLVECFSSEQSMTGLIKLVADENMTTKLIRLVKDGKLSCLIRDRYLKSANNNNLSAAQRQWVQKSVGSSKELLRPLATSAAKLYYSRTGPADPIFNNLAFTAYLAWIIWAWLHLDGTNSTDMQEMKIGNISAGRLPRFDEATYDRLVESFDCERTQYFHAANGWLLLEFNRERAQQAFRAALDIDPTYWEALEGFGKCVVHAHRYDEGTKVLDEALEHIPKTLTEPLRRVRDFTLLTRINQEDYQAVIDHCAAEYVAEFATYCDIKIQTYISALYAMNKLDHIHQILIDMSKLPPSSGLTCFLCVAQFAYKEIGIALQNYGDTDQIVQPWLDEFCKPHWLSEDFLPSLWWTTGVMVNFMMEFYPKDDLLERLEQISDPEYSAGFHEDIRSRFEESRDKLDTYLAQIYIDKIRQATKEGRDSDVSKTVAKLQALAIAEKGTDHSGPTYRISTASGILACYLRQNGAPEETWRACLRPTMLECFDMLSDDDPGNDSDAYNQLTMALHAAGDVENLVLLSTGYWLEAIYPTAAEQGFVELRWNCDGPCSTSFVRLPYKDGTSRSLKIGYREAWCCLSCVNGGFCDECLGLLKSGEMPLKKCSPHHQFVKFYPLPENSRFNALTWNREKGMLEVNREWLDGLRKVWTQ